MYRYLLGIFAPGISKLGPRQRGQVPRVGAHDVTEHGSQNRLRLQLLPVQWP